MITLLKQGIYQLAESKSTQTKILTLDKQVYAWPNTAVGEILVTSSGDFMLDSVLSSGQYRLYQVKDEPGLVDLVHLELEVGPKDWQGYLLPTGLPDKQDTKNRIIPTQEIISK